MRISQLAGLAAMIALIATVACSGANAQRQPCQQIRKACLAAGFHQGGAKAGEGVINDCLAPLMSGLPQRPNASIPLPTVDRQLVAECKRVNPKFGGPMASMTVAPPLSANPEPVPVAGPPPTRTDRPNIVFILADDFSWDLLSPDLIEQSMPNVARMRREGATFLSYFVTDSLCCPSRSSIFTGKLPHNTNVFTNTPPLGGYGAFMAHNDDAHTFALTLQQAGYKTAMLGKYLNGYEPATNGVPQGWSEWDVDGDQGYGEFNYPLNQNGTVLVHPDYLTDVVSKLGRLFIGKSAAEPFFIEIATFAPHAPYIPAPRDADHFPGLTYPRGPSWGVRPDAAAPQWLQQIPPMRPGEIAAIEKAHRMRVQSDQAIDEMIGDIRALLARAGLDRNTYIVFSSDNGYHMGEYSLRPGKMTPFDTDIRVPLIIVGPGVPAGRTVSEITENVDLAPTFAEIAGRARGQTGPLDPDGHSLMPLLRADGAAEHESWRHVALVEHRHPVKDPTDPDIPEPSSGNPPSYEAVRLPGSMYVEYDDPQHEVGYYDLKADPLEMRNIVSSLTPAQRKRLHDILTVNSTCVGVQACWAAQQQLP
ncbi:MAG: sulfatase [Caulobacterales bacterium]